MMKLRNRNSFFPFDGKQFLFLLIVVVTAAEALLENSWDVQENIHFVLDS